MSTGSPVGPAPPLVTVLMAVYNGQAHVRQAVEGILAQTFRDFEFVIVDDGSTDGTSRVLDEYDDPRIVRLKHESNRGLIAALNTGLAAARGEFVARQDADDFSFPQRLQTQVDFLRSRPDVAVVGSDTFFEPVEGGARSRRTVETDPLRLAWTLLFYCPLTHSSILFRREAIQVLGGYGEADVFAEDFALWARVSRSSKVASVGAVLVIRRRPPESITERHGSDMGRAARRVSLQNLRWVTNSSIPEARLDALQAFCGNRTLVLSHAVSLEFRELRATADHVFEGFRAKIGPESAIPDFRRWAFRWMGRALLRRSEKLLADSSTHDGSARSVGRQMARALVRNAIAMNPAVISNPGEARVALRVALRAAMMRA